MFVYLESPNTSYGGVAIEKRAWSRAFLWRISSESELLQFFSLLSAVSVSLSLPFLSDVVISGQGASYVDSDAWQKWARRRYLCACEVCHVILKFSHSIQWELAAWLMMERQQLGHCETKSPGVRTMVGCRIFNL